MDKKKVQQGGKRKGAGRKSPFLEPTKTISFRCPLSKVDELKIYVVNKLLSWSQNEKKI